MSGEIFIVIGSTGEYDGYQEWPVEAFTDLAHASILCGTLNRWCKKHGFNVRGESRHVTCPFDVSFTYDYLTGTEYSIRIVPLNTLSFHKFMQDLKSRLGADDQELLEEDK